MTRNRNRTIGFIATLLLHASLMVFWIHRAGSAPEASASTKHEVEVTLLPPQSTVTTMPGKDSKPLPIVEDGLSALTGVPGSAVVACTATNKKYHGIGIVYNPFTGIVLQAPTAYPAYKAGIRVGDRAFMFIPSEDGHLLVDLQRLNGDRFSVYILPVTICFTEETKST